MTAFADLDQLTYFPLADSSALRAVGWLAREHEFRKGAVKSQFFERLCALLVSPWQPLTFAGAHRCDLCQFSGGPAQFTFGEMTISLGVNNLFVPGKNCLYVAPSLIAHYVDAHAYQPPGEFLQAVVDCPDTQTTAYKKLLLANGGRGLAHLGRNEPSSPVMTSDVIAQGKSV